MNQELLRLVDGIARDKNINKEVVFEDLESAMLSAIRKAYDRVEDVSVKIDRGSGDIIASVGGKPMSMRELSRIAAQTAKQVMIQKIREAERGSIFEEYADKKGQIVRGRVSRKEGGSLIVDIARTEAILPKGEQIPGETHEIGDTIRAMILEVREQGSQVRIVLSRTHPEFVRRLFELEVPEVAEKIIEIRVLAREAGYRTKVAVNSLDTKVDAVGACVGVRGSRIKSIVDELGGEKIDIVRWNDSSKILIANALKPAEVYDISLCFELGRAIVVVTEDQLSLAIGKRGQNVRLAARLTGWDVDILTPTEFNAGLDALEKALLDVAGVESQAVSQIIALGMVNVLDVEEVGPDPLVKELQLDRALAEKIVSRCSEEARRIAEAGRGRDRSARAEVAAAAGKEEAGKAESAATGQPPVKEEPGKVESDAAGETPAKVEPIPSEPAGQTPAQTLAQTPEQASSEPVEPLPEVQTAPAQGEDPPAPPPAPPESAGSGQNVT